MIDKRLPNKLDEKRKPFISYYNEHSIMPVKQDIRDPEFEFKRNALYTLLGIPLAGFSKKTILEFGPGGGWNAVALLKHAPSLYVFVDGATVSLKELERKKNSDFGGVNVEIIDSDIFDFRDSRLYDLVIIEGVLPGQIDPARMLKHAGSFVALNGYLNITTTSATSVLSEVLRRLFRPLIFDSANSFEAQIDLACGIFEPHLRTLQTSTRPIRDWVLDSILHPWEKNAEYIFSMMDAVSVLAPGFKFYNSSPRFLIDDRFYKQIDHQSKDSNQLLAEQFDRLNFSLLDYRVSLIEVIMAGINDSTDVETICKEIYAESLEIIDSNTYMRLGKVMALLRRLRQSMPGFARPTARAIDEFIQSFPMIIERKSSPVFSEFNHWWGRGQQYVSFIKT